MNAIESEMRTVLGSRSFVFGFLLLVTISLPLTGISTVVSYGFALTTYMILLFFVARYLESVVISTVYLILLCLLSGILVLASLVSPSSDSAIRVGAFFVFTLSNLLIIPHIISFRDMTFIVGRYAAGLALVGVLPYLGIKSLFGVFDLSLWGADLYLYPTLQPITSIFSNPNALGFVLLVGAIAAVIETSYSLRRAPAILVILNSVGLLFTNYRTGWVVFAIIISLYIVYVVFGREMYTIAAAGGLAMFSVVLLMMFDLLPGPVWLKELSLNGRRLLWQNTVTAIERSPIIGLGFGDYTEVVRNPHNSYLRMLLELGIGGGVVYTVIILQTLRQSTREAINWNTLGISLYLIGFFFVQMMNSLTFIGISFHSAFISIMIGYHIRNNGISAYGSGTSSASV
jgi:O-antigen ligase